MRAAAFHQIRYHKQFFGISFHALIIVHKTKIIRENFNRGTPWKIVFHFFPFRSKCINKFFHLLCLDLHNPDMSEISFKDALSQNNRQRKIMQTKTSTRESEMISFFSNIIWGVSMWTYSNIIKREMIFR